MKLADDSTVIVAWLIVFLVFAFFCDGCMSTPSPYGKWLESTKVEAKQ